jgi:magnesium chelatase accessory protein
MRSEFLLLALALVIIALGAWKAWSYYRRGPALPSPFPAVPVRMAEVGDLQIRYHLSGRGPCMVLIHGIGANLFCWRWIVPLLNRKFTVLALDLPGFGQSSKPLNAHYGLDDQVQRLKQLFAHLGLQPKVLVGNSMGGNIALWYALQNPDPGLCTVVIAPAASPSLVPFAAKQLHWLSSPLTRLVNRQAILWAHRRTVSNKELVDHSRVSETYLTYKNDKGAVRSFILATESIRDPRLLQGLTQLRSPLLVLWGTHDRLVSRAVIEGLQNKVSQAETHVHQGGGHHLQEDEPQWVSDKIDAFTSRNLD